MKQLTVGTPAHLQTPFSIGSLAAVTLSNHLKSNDNRKYFRENGPPPTLSNTDGNLRVCWFQTDLSLKNLFSFLKALNKLSHTEDTKKVAVSRSSLSLRLKIGYGPMTQLRLRTLSFTALKAFFTHRPHFFSSDGNRISIFQFFAEKLKTQIVFCLKSRFGLQDKASIQDWYLSLRMSQFLSGKVVMPTKMCL